MFEWIFVLLRIPDTIILACRLYQCKFTLPKVMDKK